jgi:Zn-dependent protease
MKFISLLFSEPLLFVMLAASLLYSVIAHEVAHGWVAYLFGDDTAKRSGRLTMNPIPHLDPVGALMLFFVGFGWAKPVPVDYGRFKKTRFGLISVALAGCATNIFIATVCLFLLQWESIRTNPVFYSLLPPLARINIILGAFNLIPIPPLDGSKILMGFLPEENRRSFARFEAYGFFLLILLLFTGLLEPVIVFMQNLIYGFIVMLFQFLR